MVVNILFFFLWTTFPFFVGFLRICMLAPGVWIYVHEASAKIQNINEINKLETKHLFIIPQLNSMKSF